MSSSFARMAGWCAIVAGLAALAYSITFAVVVQDGDRWAQWTSTLLLGLGALAALPVVIALLLRVRGADEGFALLALAFGVLGAGGTLFHATFDLGNLANDPGRPFDYPSPTDPAASPPSCWPASPSPSSPSCSGARARRAGSSASAWWSRCCSSGSGSAG
jgi:hypothetical protein